MAKAPDLSPRALSLVEALLARLPASVPDLETWWEGRGKVTRLELQRLLRQLDGERLVFDRDAGEVRPLAGKASPSPQVRAAVPTRARRHPGTSTPIISERMLKASTPTAPVGESVADMVTNMPPAAFLAKAAEVLGAGILTVGHGSKPDPGQPLASDPSAPVTAVVGGVTISGSSAAVKEAAKAYQRALLSQPTPRPPARRGPAPSASSVSERVRASVCRKPGTVGEVIARFPDVNENTVRGALGALKARGTVSHTGGKYGAPRG